MEPGTSVATSGSRRLSDAPGEPSDPVLGGEVGVSAAAATGVRGGDAMLDSVSGSAAVDGGALAMLIWSACKLSASTAAAEEDVAMVTLTLADACG